MIKAVLFDLDGTLLPMDQDKFIKAYFGLMAQKMSAHGYTDPKKLVSAIWACTEKMVANDGSKSNYDVFWNAFADIYGEKSRNDIPLFDEYYLNEFQAVKDSCGFDARAAEVVKYLKARELRVIVATNPFFPKIGTESRLRWAGLDPNDFELVTTYENTNYCKPNPAYFADILARQKISPEDCVMVGNDMDEDILPAASLGMGVFILTDCLINKNDMDISKYPHGGFDELREFLEKI